MILWTIFFAISLHLPAWGKVTPDYCGFRETFVTQLEDTFGETLQSATQISTNGVFEIWRSEENGTWTLLLTTSEGISCVMDDGVDKLHPKWQEPT